MAAFNHGLKHDNDPANFIDDAKFGLVLNPVAAIPKQKAAERVGERFLTWAEARQLLDDMERPTSLGLTLRSLIRLCFFTGGQRPYELAASRWASIDWQAKTLTITADISKNGRPLYICPRNQTKRTYADGVIKPSSRSLPQTHRDGALYPPRFPPHL